VINYIITTMKQQLSGSAQQIELARQCRKTWEFNPVSRIVKDKTKFNRKQKHKNRGED